MNQLAPQRMTVEEFIDWTRVQPKGRYELEDGWIVEMPSETVLHLDVKLNVAIALRQAARTSLLPCHALTDGAMVRIDPKRSYRPDAVIYRGEKLAPQTIEIPAPVVVVEVLSPSSEDRDTVVKLANYFKVESIVHYLIVDPVAQSVVHHKRGHPPHAIISGTIILDPPGLSIAVADFFAET